MKITIEIPDAHTGSLLEFLAALSAQSSPVEAVTDPAPGHPELALAGVDAADPIKVSMDDEVDRSNLPRLVPVVTGVYRARNGNIMHAVGQELAHNRVKTLVRNDPGLPFYYESDGRSLVVGRPEWDLVEVIFEPAF